MEPSGYMFDGTCMLNQCVGFYCNPQVGHHVIVSFYNSVGYWKMLHVYSWEVIIATRLEKVSKIFSGIFFPDGSPW